MSYKYLFLFKAQQEYEDALNWYLTKNLKAAEGFTNEVDRALTLICESPKSWRNEHGNYYELNLKKYPFTIVYLIEDGY